MASSGIAAGPRVGDRRAGMERLVVSSRNDDGGDRRTLVLGIGAALALALATGSSTALPALLCWAVIVVGGGLSARRPVDVGAIGLGGIVGAAVSGAFQLGQAGGPGNVLELVVVAVFLGIVAGLLAGGVGIIRFGIVALAGERDGGVATPPAELQARAGALRGPSLGSAWLGLLLWFALGVFAILWILSLNAANARYGAVGSLLSAVVLVVAPFLAAIGWGAAALSRWRGTSTWSDNLGLAISASVVVAGIVVGAALHFAVGLSF